MHEIDRLLMNNWVNCEMFHTTNTNQIKARVFINLLAYLGTYLLSFYTLYIIEGFVKRKKKLFTDF